MNCPECGAVLDQGVTCQDQFHQMLFWEAEHPEYGVVHHLLVLCYHLQHPSQYSSEGLTVAKGLLIEFIECGSSTEEVRRQNRDHVDSGRRTWTITARPETQGAYEHPVAWTHTAASVVANGPDQYVDSVRAWARSVYEALKASGNLPK